ncbi:hypothetical protein MRX96_045505 [Rhipicephalus microplus]
MLPSFNSLQRTSKSSSDREKDLTPRNTTNGVLLQTLCSLANIDSPTSRQPHTHQSIQQITNCQHPSEPRARLCLRACELRLGTISYSLRAYMAAPDNALRGIIYNAVDSQTQDEIIQDL